MLNARQLNGHRRKVRISRRAQTMTPIVGRAHTAVALASQRVRGRWQHRGRNSRIRAVLVQPGLYHDIDVRGLHRALQLAACVGLLQWLGTGVCPLRIFECGLVYVFRPSHLFTSINLGQSHLLLRLRWPISPHGLARRTGRSRGRLSLGCRVGIMVLHMLRNITMGRLLGLLVHLAVQGHGRLLVYERPSRRIEDGIW